MYNTIFLVCDAIQDLIAHGFPNDNEMQTINRLACKCLVEQGGNPIAGHLFAEVAIAAIHLGKEDLMVASLYPDGRLLFLSTKLLNQTFLAYLEARHARSQGLVSPTGCS
jgi:hypothetical protein